MGRAFAAGRDRHQGLAAQLDAVLVVDADDLHLDLVAHPDHVIDAADVAVVEFRDVAQAVAARRNLDERAELLDARHLAVVHVADQDLGAQRLDAALGLFGPGRLAVGDGDGAVVVHVELRARLFLNGPDHLAARPDEQADLVRRNLRLQQPRGALGDRLPRGAEGREHRLQNLAAGDPGLLQGGPQDVVRDAFELDVELDAGDAVLRPGDLEVHVAVVVLVALNVGQERVAVALHDQADRDAGDRLLDRHAGVHQRQGAAADGRHRTRAVRLQDLGDEADRVRELGRRRQHGFERPLGQHAVADLAAAGGAQRLALADGERREVVVEHELLRVLVVQAIDLLLVAVGAEGDDDEGLRLAALEQGRPVGARQQVDFARQGADHVVGAAVDAGAGHRDFLEDALFQGAERAGDLLRGRLGRLALGDRVGLLDRVLQLVQRRVPGQLADGHVPLAELLAVGRVQGLDERVHRGGRREHLRAQPGGGAEGLDAVDDDDDRLVGEADRLGDDVFGEFAGEPFDHADGVAGGGDDQVEVALVHLRRGRQGDQFAVDPADADRADRVHERQVRDVQRGRRADQREHVGVVLLVGGEDVGLDLDFVDVADGEQRADRPVHEPRGERLLGAGPGLALDEAAGELAGGVGPLAVVAGEREEVAAGDRVPLDGGDEDGGLAVADQDGPVRLLGELTGLQHERAGPDGDFVAGVLNDRRSDRHRRPFRRWCDGVRRGTGGAESGHHRAGSR